MQFKGSRHTRSWLFAIPGSILVLFLVAWARAGQMQNMPGMSKRSSPQRNSAATRKRKPASSNRPGMNMRGMNMSGTHKHTRRKRTARSRRATTKHQMGKTPGMKMSATKTSPTPKATPQEANMTRMKMPQATPSPSASPQKMENMPGMQMPTPSPNAQASPQQKMEMNMPRPSPSPGASPQTMNMPMPAASPSPSAMQNMPGMEDKQGMSPMNMGPLMVMMGNDMGIRIGSSDTNVMSMGAMGSGTSWQPSSAPMHMHYKVAGDWLLMFHYNLIVGMNRQGGPRGVTKLESANWFMPMAYHKLGRGTLQLRGMVSAEPFTFPPGGSPLLFQTGETYKGQPLIDHQHPHDLFMELSAQYTLPLGERATWFTYFGYPGEPALGPVAFMHRMSASENPSATLSHHLQDSTHISFGVLTTGFTYRWFKLEGSIFNGREPDENRYNFDAHKWNSRSARLWFMPNKNWALQVSHGFLRSPEAQEPQADIRRTTASIQYNRSLHRGNWASAFIWGRNHVSAPGEIKDLNSYTAESTVQFLDKNYLYARLELVDKDDLLRASDRALLGITQHHPSFRIGAYTFGGARDVWNNNKVSVAFGSDLTFYSKPPVLDAIYGNHPVSWKLFVRVRPAKMDMSPMHSGHDQNKGTP
jgi:hypothetical protein